MAGSIIIVTTRNEAVLDQSEFEVVYKYELNELDEEHALLLFNRHAFRTDHSLRDFEGVSRDVISTMGGLPLALEVVGSYLYKKTNRKVWEDVQKQLKSQPHRDVQKILRISYDALEDGHKHIFLDIVCFFIGEESSKERRKYAMYMWEDCGFYPSQGIEELKLRCLIKIGDNGKFMIHDQLIDLGRSIFCQEQLLEKRSGPWDRDYNGITRALGHQWLGSFGPGPWFDDWTRAALRGDSNELLSRNKMASIVGRGVDPSLLTTNLPKLSVLDLSENSITEDWEGWSTFMTAKRLLVLDLRWCNGFRCTPDLSAFTQLKILTLRVSRSYREEVGELKDLEELVLDDSWYYKDPYVYWLSEEVEDTECLPFLVEIQGSDNLEFLEGIFIYDCNSIKRLLCPKSWCLKKLVAVKCNNLVEIRGLDGAKFLEELDFTGCESMEMLPNLTGCEKLRSLNVRNCKKLTQLGGFEKLDLIDLNISGCYSLEAIPKLSRTRRLMQLHSTDITPQLNEALQREVSDLISSILMYAALNS
ncbi:disease resistance protein L6-like [Syzygium oleosum]|uniref:disease resistance protein L6-like n=1 Tax=Syzygium oleosum TaxID=219896 RepID=UPI0024B94B16|nr:disease resistance protein L6-like [Syzygium oleosum]